MINPRSAFIMPSNRYPVMLEGVHAPEQNATYTVIFDVVRAVQHGAILSPVPRTTEAEPSKEESEKKKDESKAEPSEPAEKKSKVLKQRLRLRNQQRDLC